MGELVMNQPAAWRHNGEKDKEPLHYTACGLDDIYLKSGYEIVKTPHGEGVAIKKLDELHLAIGCNLAERKKLLSAKELRFLRKHMDLTQSELGKLLGLTSQQVARWEKGESEISGSAEFLLRAYFIQHAGGTLNLQELVSALDEIDAPANEKSFFAKTATGWHAQMAA
jgi:putative transcriptional regulator